ncbi:hypothetical protein CIK05_15100 [Bdellovibrio sp. qaytius]|nr:hypothetical protein CIK05_15100 [Bdellovibrio sp. qaytius]
MHATVLNLAIFIFLVVKAPLVWGFSFSENSRSERLQNYLNIARQEKLWTDPQWLALGHYEKKYFSYTSPFTEGLFLDADGAKSPEKELLKTIELLYGENDQKLQCHYLARAQWLNQILRIDSQDILPCEERQAWKKQLNVQGVSLIFAASDMGNASSSFGHTFLKLINPENAANKDLIDYGINYAADADPREGALYPIKGLFGLYTARFTLLPYHQKIREYINLEGRDIWEYNFNFTAEETDFLVNHLIEMENARAPYYFFSDNCSYQILKTLEVVRPDLKLSQEFQYFTIPIDTVKKLTRVPSPLFVSRKYKKSLKTDYLESFAKLGVLQKKALDIAVTKLSIPDDYELAPLEKAQVYETAMKYYSLQAFTTNKDFDNEKYQLFLKRAAMGMVAGADYVSKPEPPEDSHDSSALYFGVGQSDFKSKNITYTSLKFRHALHDLEQQDFGTVAFSQNEMAAIEARYLNTDGDAKDFHIYKFTVLDLINLNPVTQLDKNFSWKFRGDIVNNMETFTDDKFSADIEASGGYSFDLALFERTRVAYLMTARHWKTSINSVGPELLLVSRLKRDLGFSLDLTYFGQRNSTDFLRARSKLNYTFRKNFDVQLAVENGINKEFESQLQLVWNFIL